MAALELLAPQRGERILDLGCGDGALTTKLKERGCAVVGVDASYEMVDAVRAFTGGFGARSRITPRDRLRRIVVGF